jgi:hypothetical protein
MNRLKTTFLKNYDLKTQKSAYLNRRQYSAFFENAVF